MRVLFLTILTVSILSGCTFSKDGIGIVTSGEGDRQVYQDRKFQLALNAKSAGVTVDDQNDLGLILLGSTGPYREFTEKNVENFYTAYLRMAHKNQAEETVLYDLDSFLREFSGWTSVASIHVAGLAKRSTKALVPGELFDTLEFPSAITSHLFVDTDDFVAAKTNADGVFIIRKLLCPDDEMFYTCTKQYESGYFDALTGEKIDQKTGVPLNNGDRIDLTTFRVLPSE